MASQLGHLMPYLGGSDHGTVLLPLLEALGAVEESYVRDSTSGSFNNLLDQCGTSFKTIASYWECLRRLAGLELGEVFYPRYTAAKCLHSVYGAVGRCEGMTIPVIENVVQKNPSEGGEDGEKEGSSAEEAREPYKDVAAMKADILSVYTTLQNDEISIVRKAAVTVFFDFVNVAEPEIIPAGMLESFRISLKDDCSPIRTVAIGALTMLADKLKEIGVNVVLVSEILPFIKDCAADESWRIRLAISTNFSRYASSFGPEEITSELFPILINLVRDPEPEVRQVALPELLAFLPVVGEETFLTQFLTITELLVDDPVSIVRKLLATLCVDIAAKVDTSVKGNLGDQICDIIIKLTNDEDPMIKLRVLKKLMVIAKDIPALCKTLTDTLRALFSDSNWRVRSEMIYAIPSIIENLGKDHFAEFFMAEFLGMLRDSVDEVRLAAADTLTKVVTMVGIEWTYEKIFVAIKSMSHADFLLRLSMLGALQGLLQAELPSAEAFQSECLALVVASTNDRVPNVRLKAAQVLSKACTIVGHDVSTEIIRPVLNDLQGDSDRDVAYFAAEGMKLCA